MTVYARYTNLTDHSVEIRAFDDFAAYSAECRAREPFTHVSLYLGHMFSAILGPDGTENVFFKAVGEFNAAPWWIHDQGGMELANGELANGEIFITHLTPGMNRFMVDEFVDQAVGVLEGLAMPA